MRDKNGPHVVAERTANVLHDAREQRAPALLRALMCHLSELRRVAGQVGAQTVARHARAAVVLRLRTPEADPSSELKSEGGDGGAVLLGRGGERTLGVVVEVVVLQAAWAEGAGCIFPVSQGRMLMRLEGRRCV